MTCFNSVLVSFKYSVILDIELKNNLLKKAPRRAFLILLFLLKIVNCTNTYKSPLAIINSLAYNLALSALNSYLTSTSKLSTDKIFQLLHLNKLFFPILLVINISKDKTKWWAFFVILNFS